MQFQLLLLRKTHTTHKIIACFFLHKKYQLSDSFQFWGLILLPGLGEKEKGRERGGGGGLFLLETFIYEYEIFKCHNS